MPMRRLFVVLIATALNAGETAMPTVDDLRTRHLAVGERLDTLYFNAGRRIDVVACDLREAARRDRQHPPELLERVETADCTLRDRWRALDAACADAEQRIVVLPRGAQTLRIETLDPSSAPYDGWFMIRSAGVTWADGSRTDIPLDAFQGGRGPMAYDYNCPPALAVWVYGTNTDQPAMTAQFDAGREPLEPVSLVLKGQDDDKPGVVRIRISLNNTVLFEGPNGFVHNDWSEHSFAVPTAAFASEPASTDMGDLSRELTRLAEEIEQFGREAAALADEIAAVAEPVVRDLTLPPAPVDVDVWRDHFLRGAYFEGLLFRSLPEEEIDVVAAWSLRMARDARINFLSGYLEWYTTRNHLSRLLRANRAVGIPYIESWHGGGFPYSDPQGFDNEVREYLDLWREYPAMVGIEVDEPTAQYEELEKAAAAGLFHRYLAERAPVLEAAGFRIPADAWPSATFTNDTERALWVEWRTWGARLMADFFRDRWEQLEARDRTMFTVIMSGTMTRQPQLNSFAAMGPAMPLISTDIYLDSDVQTGFSLQLLRNASLDRCIFVPGAGYSMHSPARFRRDLAVAMTHADGVCMWTWCYFEKYRAPRVFWRTQKDDRGRPLRNDWAPEYWDITRDMYARMERADAYLARTDSCAPVVLLVSERTLMVDSHDDELVGKHFENNYGVYAALVRRAAPIDARLLETTSADDLRRYKVALLVDARSMTPEQAVMLREWTADGGTLIAGGASSLCDEWGRALADFALADVFGVKFLGETADARTFEIALADKQDGGVVRVTAPAENASILVRPETARSLASWDTGDPAVLRNRHGKGACVIFTARWPGMVRPGGAFGMKTGQEPGTGMPGEGSSGFPSLIRALVDLALADGPQPLRVTGSPDGPRTLEVQLRKAGDAYVLHLLDWAEDREVNGLRLAVDVPGAFDLLYPTDAEPRAVPINGPASVDIRPFRIHEMIVVRPRSLPQSKSP